MDIIANYFIARNSSGFVEGLNNKVKVLKIGLWTEPHEQALIQFSLKSTPE